MCWRRTSPTRSVSRGSGHCSRGARLVRALVRPRARASRRGNSARRQGCRCVPPRDGPIDRATLAGQAQACGSCSSCCRSTKLSRARELGWGSGVPSAAHAAIVSQGISRSAESRGHHKDEGDCLAVDPAPLFAEKAFITHSGGAGSSFAAMPFASDQRWIQEIPRRPTYSSDDW
jgi:hypothetical protein